MNDAVLKHLVLCHRSAGKTILTLSQTSPSFYVVCSRNLLETLWGKEEIACDKLFLLFPQCFRKIFDHFSSNLKLWSANSFSLEESKICRLGKG